MHRSHTIDQHAVTSIVPHIGHSLDDDEDETLEEQIEVLEQDLKKLKQRQQEKDAQDFSLMSSSDHHRFEETQDDNSTEEKAEITQVQMVSAPPPSDEPPVSVQNDTIPAPPSVSWYYIVDNHIYVFWQLTSSNILMTTIIMYFGLF